MSGRIKHKIEGVYPDTPVLVAARRILKSRIADLEHYLREARGEAEGDVEVVHQLRVATRRAGSALRVLRRFCDPKIARRFRRALRAIRQAASAARREDVHLDRLRADAADASPELSTAYDVVLSALLQSRREAQASLESIARARSLNRLRKLRRQLLKSIGYQGHGDPATNGSTAIADVPIYNLRELACVELPPVAALVREAAQVDLGDVQAVHGLRIAGKKLRYSMELLADWLPDHAGERAYEYLEGLQEQLGELNDLSEIAHRIATLPEVSSQTGVADGCAQSMLCSTLSQLRDDYAFLRDQKHQDLLNWLNKNSPGAVLDVLLSAVSPHRAAAAHLRHSSADHELHSAPPADALHRRIAAIDVGTNSVRLVVAETDAIKGFRIIEDVKETTRLGGGVFSTGRLQSSAIEKTLAALERMRSVCIAKNVEHVRAVGTSAVREATNRAEFLELALRRTGIDIEVLGAEQEARLAFSSVANTFDLDDRCVAVADIGGGSTELVLSTAGVIDAIYPLPLGAVRLTELYGASKGEYRYDDMTQAISRAIGERLHNSHHRPYQIIGTGGTFTSLARVAMVREPAAGGPVRFSFALGGYEFRHAQVMRLLEWLKSTPLEERRRLPGLSSARAEIIVAGVSIVEKLMQHFGVDRLRVHDGGIRDGLLLQMVDEIGVHIEPPRAHGAEVIESVRRFAERCEYDSAHSEHVAFLSLRVFDQLAEQGVDLSGTWSRLDHRTLLHAAGILHDVGMLIDWEQHHLHSYDLVRHADLPSLSRREVEIVANACRYHRRGGPRRKDANLQRLSNDDQRLVAHLAGILRIADGLDRSHARLVSDVLVEVDDDRVGFRAVAERCPKEELRVARKKADVFQAAFHVSARVKWTRADSPVEPDAIGATL